MSRILDKDFKYTPAINTDIRKKFEEVKERIKAEKDRAEALIAEAEERAKRIAEEVARKVKPLIKMRSA